LGNRAKHLVHREYDKNRGLAARVTATAKPVHDLGNRNGIEGAMFEIDLGGKTALVCGAGGGGLGSAVSRILAEAGANLIAVDQTEAQVAETKVEVERLGVSCQTIVADLMDPAQAAGLVDRALALAGPIDIVVNVAGGTRFHQWKPIEETTDEILRDVLALNLDYVFRVCADAGRHMIAAKRPGAIVNFTSISGLRGAPFHGPYGMAKRGVMAMTETMAIEWARHGIRVNTVAPSGVVTPRASRYSGADPDKPREIVDGHRMMMPVDVARAVLFLVSDLAGGVSGQTLVVDAGLSSRNPAGGLAEYGKMAQSADAIATAEKQG
jgi:NAD(P)-dependent dehydrogenase (short-subunit alcohol dehydrogenase family)